jgi:pimeloyl-ACP methyl ester carboxylesterase
MPKTSLLFLPGLLCDEALFRAQVAGLADVADSTVADLTQDDSVAAMAARALAAAPADFALCALSMGGYVAFEILRLAPERVTRLALLDTSAKPDTDEKKARRRALMDQAKRGRFKGVTPKLLPTLVAPAHRTGPIADEVLAMAGRVGKEAFLRQQSAIMNRPDSRPTLTHVAVPTLVGVGAQDQITPLPEAEEMQSLIQGSTLHVFGESGHLPPLEQPDETTAVLRAWLSA